MFLPSGPDSRHNYSAFTDFDLVAVPDWPVHSRTVSSCVCGKSPWWGKAIAKHEPAQDCTNRRTEWPFWSPNFNCFRNMNMATRVAISTTITSNILIDLRGDSYLWSEAARCLQVCWQQHLFQTRNL
jgi:hypothetical protein